MKNIHNVKIAKDVLYLAEKGELGFWHSAKGSVSPASTFSWFDLGTILPAGGELVDIATYTLDGGDGPDDFTAFVASTGWVALYRGSDPADATDWSIIGRYNLGQALGKRCTMEIAGDVVVLTVNGYISLAQFIQIGGLSRQSFAFNDLIQQEVVRQTLDYKGEFGWQAILVPNLTLALFNVPQSSNNFVQHVVNTQTSAWARTKKWNGLCWLNTSQNLFFGTADGKVIDANVGDTDVGGLEIEGDGITAFSYMGQRGVRKLWQMYRPILETAGNVSIRMALPVDFDLDSSLGPARAVPLENAATWNVDEWNVSNWGGAASTTTNWLTIGKLGYAAAIRLNVVSTGQLCRWKSADISYTLGGLL